MKKVLIILLCGVVFLVCLLGYTRYQNRDDINIVMNRGKVSSDMISAEITNISYAEGWLTGSIDIHDESISDYYNKKECKDGDFTSYLASIYDLTIEINNEEEVLTEDVTGFTIKDSGDSFYSESFKHYLKNFDDDQIIQIHICGIDEPLEIILKTQKP